jgi:hypothetical protein
MLLGDGAVRFLDGSMNHHAIMTIAGSESVPSLED